MNKYQWDITEKTLSNGMHVILVHKPDFNRSLFMLSTQAGGYDIKQQVGSAIETHPSGCAHFLEHQMFRLNGVDVTDEFAIMGAQTNAFTSFSKTAYFFQTTSDIGRPLDLLMDFVQHLDIDYESVEKEKGIILSEYDMYQQSPVHRLLHDCWESMYLAHPIKTDILGTRLDISQMSVEQLQRFYDLNYDPARLTLVGITGKDTEQIMEQIVQHQENVPSQHPERVTTFFEEEVTPVIREQDSITMEVSTPYVVVGYKCAPIPDIRQSLKTDMAVQIRLDSLFSTMNPKYQEWMDQRIITPVMGAECDFTQEHGYIMVYAQTGKPEEFIHAVEQEIQAMAQEEISADAFEALHAGLIAQNIRISDQFENLAVELLEAHQKHYSLSEHFQMAEGLCAEDVNEICRGLDFSHETVSTILPKTSES